MEEVSPSLQPCGVPLPPQRGTPLQRAQLFLVYIVFSGAISSFTLLIF